MEYPIIDTLANAYIRNGWTGLDLSTGKNLFNPIISSTNAFSYVNGIFTNTITDTRPFVRLVFKSFNNNVQVSYRALDITTPGRYSLSMNVGQNITRFEFGHSGTARDLFVVFPFNGTSSYYTLSLNIISASVNVIGGFSFDDVMIELGDQATPYEPYYATTDIFSRTRLPIIRYFPHALIDSLKRASEGNMTNKDREILTHYLTPLGIGGI